MKRFKSFLGFATLYLTVCHQAFTQIPVHTIAYTGKQAPGTGVVFDYFYPPTISTLSSYMGIGDVMFTGRLFGPGVDETNQYGIWMYESVGGLGLIARKGDQAPGFPAGTRFEHLGFSNALVGPHNNVVSGFRTLYFATLTGGAFASGTRSLWLRGFVAPGVIAYTGQTWDQDSLGPLFTPVRYNRNAPDNSQITYSASIYRGTYSADTVALWISEEDPDSTGRIQRRVVFKRGDQIPELAQGLQFGAPMTHLLCDDGSVVFLAGIFTSSGSPWGYGIWRKRIFTQMEPMIVALNGVPVALPGLNAGESIGQFEYLLANSIGSIAFSATISGSPGGYGFWAQDTGSFRLVMRAGMAAPGLPSGVTFHSLSEFSNSPRCMFLTNVEDAIFLAKLQGTGVTSANDMAVWRTTSSGLQMLAREGDQMPGATAGVVFDRIERVAANKLGEIVIEATIRGPGITTANDLGIWGLNRLGQYVPAVQKGNRVEVEPGVMRTVNSVTLAVGDPDSYSTGTDGRSTVFNQSKEVVFYASFLDNGVVVTAVCAAELQTIFTDVQESSSRLPFAFSLHQNYPNPFNPTTTIRYDLPSASFVSLKVFDIIGREVRTLANEVQDAGFKSVRFEALGFSSGIYFYRLQAGSFQETRKLILVK